MLEYLLNTPRRGGGVLGPGPQTLVAGTSTLGFFGEVPTADLVSGDTLASTIGLAVGTAQYSTEPWLKFIRNGKVLYIAKKPYRHGVSWQDIYQAGAVYGDGTNGKYPSGTARLQNAAFSVSGYNFKVRLIRGNSKDPTAGTYSTSANNPAESAGSEWNDLMYPVSNGVWASYTNSELEIVASGINDGQTWCMETVNSVNRVLRGVSSIQDFYARSATDSMSYRAWRPLLELV